jgi:hypothetical protein
MASFNNVTVEVLGIPLRCDLVQADDAITCTVTSEDARKCYKKALQYLVFGRVPKSLKIALEYSGELYSVTLYQTVQMTEEQKVFWLRIFVDSGVPARLCLSSSLSDYLAVSSKQQISFSLFTIQE